LVLNLTAGAIAAASPTDEVVELTLGDWFGGAQSWGMGAAVVRGAPLTWSGQFKASYEFTVTESSVAGTFDLSTSGLLGASAITMRYETSEGTMLAEYNAVGGSGGEISGTRSDVVFSSRPMKTVGTVWFTSPQGEMSFPIDGEPSAVTILTTITSMSCDQVIGDWNTSISTQIEQAGWETNFKGIWLAWPRPPEDQQTELDQLIDGMEQLFEDYADFDASLGVGDEYDTTRADWSEFESMIDRAVEIQNRIHNLSACDQQAIGAEVIQEWSNALASLVGNLIIAVADAGVAYGLRLPFSGLIYLIAGADAIGAYGAGSMVDPGLAFQVEQALIDLTSNSVEGHLIASRGESQSDSCNAACRQDNYLWAAGGVVEAVTHGWTITVEGQSYSPAEVGAVLANPPGDS
jgi:hypothetical protein